MSDTCKAALIWALGDGVGQSSKCIAQHLMGLKPNGSYPSDGGDFMRCEGLLDAVPEFRDRIGEMASVNAYWAALAPAWESIRQSSDKYEAIKRLTRPVEKGDPNVVRLGEGVLIRFGGE